MGLFVTRATEALVGGRSGDDPGPRFIPFPPKGFASAGLDFDGENPDPRPGVRSGPGQQTVTGLPITISLRRDDVQRYRATRAVVRKAGGKEIEVWVTDPAHPSVSAADRSIYAPGEADDGPFAHNFDMVFIMPRLPLEPGTTYQVEADLSIGTEMHSLRWDFSTRPPRRFRVSPRPERPWNDLRTALQAASTGDTVEVAAGEYLIDRAIRLDGVRIVGAGAGTVIRFAPTIQYAPLSTAGALVLEHLTLHAARSVLYMRAGASVLLDDVALSGGDGSTTAFVALPGTTLVLRGLSAGRFSANTLVYAEDPGRAPRAVIYADAASRANGKSLVYGPADLGQL
jgi:hypothetical protein